jgi:hypothetical protein
MELLKFCNVHLMANYCPGGHFWADFTMASCFRTAGGEDEISKLDAELKDGELLSQVSHLKNLTGV